MTQKALDRLAVIQQVTNRQLRQYEAARQLGLSIRQVKRLVARFRQEGPPGLVSRRLGRRPGNAFSEAVRREIMALVREHYADFGPTLACEKLVELHGRQLSVETLRQWMIADGLWQPRKRKAPRIHQQRPAVPGVVYLSSKAKFAPFTDALSHHPKGDISAWEKRGHFRIGLTGAVEFQ